MSGRIGRIDGFDAGFASLALAGAVLEIAYIGERRRRREPARQTSPAPAPLPGDLKRWAPPVVTEMPRQQRRALMRTLGSEEVG